MSALPVNLDIEHARLPATYTAAKHALAECSRIDVCQQWADKAEALASYARQANDQEMRKMCDRIQARAILRCGELLAEIPADKGGRPSETQDGSVPSFTRTAAAAEAGLSERQRKTALRVANLPRDEFEAAVEAADPATVTELATRGIRRRQPAVDHLGGRDPADYQQATMLLGAVRRFNNEIAEIDLAAAHRGLWPVESAELNAYLDQSRAWLDKISGKGG